MKNSVVIIVLFFFNLSFGQVGIGTINPNASSILDIQSTNKGLLIPRILLTGKSDNITVATPSKGLIVYNINTNLIQMPNGEGIYYNIGTSILPIWEKLASQKSSFSLINSPNIVAVTNIDYPATAVTVSDIDLGLSFIIEVPANSEAVITIDYNVPIGTNVLQSDNTGLTGYFGIRFLKNTVEQPQGSRKFSIPYSGSASKMVSVSGKFIETVVNSNATALQITYTLNGYLENTSRATRFNMWQPTGDNFNWGKASMSSSVFIKN